MMIKKWLACTLVIGSGSFLGLVFLLHSDHPVLFESLESKTQNGSPVYNRVRFHPGWNQDVWLMQQSHHGIGSDFSRWDRLAIVVDKATKPYRATFLQLKEGVELQMAEPILYRARCYACHANGPRAIRPHFDSRVIQIGLVQRAQIMAWNLRVKSYGRVESRPAPGITGGVPFKSDIRILSRPLGLETCTRCHSENGIRNTLRLEQLGTAKFLVSQGFMPPFPFRATAQEINRLNQLSR